MPTPKVCSARSAGLDAAEQEWQLLHAMPRAVRWMNDKLEGLDADGYHENAQSPMMQADGLILHICLGWLH